MEHVQRDARLPGRGDQLPAAVGGRGERLVGDRRHPRRDGLQHQRAAGLRRRGDGHRVDPGGEQVGQRVVGGHAGEVGGQLGAPSGERVTTPASSTSCAAAMNGAWKYRPPTPYPTSPSRTSPPGVRAPDVRGVPRP